MKNVVFKYVFLADRGEMLVLHRTTEAEYYKFNYSYFPIDKEHNRMVCEMNDVVRIWVHHYNGMQYCLSQFEFIDCLNSNYSFYTVKAQKYLEKSPGYRVRYKKMEVE